MTTYDEIKNGRIRQLNISKDLNQVADLIEICFVGTIDEEGNDYIRYLRRMAEDSQNSYWGLGEFQRTYAPLQGFVYTLDEKIIGNLSLLPFHKSGEFIYLIANVAVRPEFRRKGIARQLTTRALQYAHSKAARSAWLQVRDDNPGAHQLYVEMGFDERCRRSTWTLYPKNFHPKFEEDLFNIRSTNKSDWKDHQDWLSDVYPDMVRWNLGFRLERLKPALFNKIAQFVNGQSIRNYVVENHFQHPGYITFERTSLYSDTIWLACDDEDDEIVLAAFYQLLVKKYKLKKPLSINLPVGRAEQVLENLGFVKNHTLIWMEESTINSILREN